MLLLVLALWALPRPAGAHSVSNSHWSVRLDRASASGSLRVAIRDLDVALGLDDDGDGLVSDAELGTHARAIELYLLEHLELGEPGRPCALRGTGIAPRGSTLELGWSSECALPGAVALRYDLFFEHDSSHQAYLDVTGTLAAEDVLRADRRSVTVGEGRGREPLPAFGEHVAQGVRHILIGYDHLAFLLTLLTASVFGVGAGRGREAGGARPAIARVAGVVTAFTAAHSLTSSLAALGLVSLPARWVEPLIALSVALAALNNLWPLVRRRVWLLAFGFGLLHGFGFAGVLLELGLAPGRRAATLLGFNIGVELGQLGLCALGFPALVALSRLRRFDPRPISAALCAAGLFWLGERLLAGGAESGPEAGAAEPALRAPSPGDELARRGETLLLAARWGEAHRALSEAEQLHLREGNVAARARDLSLLGDVLVSSADPAGARQRYSEALAAREALRDRRGAAQQHQNLGVVARLAGDAALAARHLRRAIELYTELGQDADSAQAMAALARVYLGSGAYADAEQMYLRANDLDRARGHRRQLAKNHNQLGNLYLLSGDLARAESMYDESRRLAEAEGDRLAMANGAANLAGVYARTGRAEAARALYRRCLDWFEQSGADAKTRRVRGLLAALERDQVSDPVPGGVSRGPARP